MAACRPPIPPLGCLFSFFLFGQETGSHWRAERRAATRNRARRRGLWVYVVYVNGVSPDVQDRSSQQRLSVAARWQPTHIFFLVRLRDLGRGHVGHTRPHTPYGERWCEHTSTSRVHTCLGGEGRKNQSLLVPSAPKRDGLHFERVFHFDGVSESRTGRGETEASGSPHRLRSRKKGKHR